MTMAVDSSQSRFLGYDTMHQYSHHTGPHFTNPWTAASGTSASQQTTSSPSMFGNMSQHASLSGMEALRPQNQLPQPIPHQYHHQQQQQAPQAQQTQHHHAQQHQQPSPGPQHQQAPSHHHQTQHHQTQQPQHLLPQPTQQPPQQQHQQTQQQRLPQPPPPMHRGSTSTLPNAIPYGNGGMAVTAAPTAQGASPHSRTNVADAVRYRNDMLIATTSAAYADSTAAYSTPSPIHPTGAYTTAAAPYDQMGYASATQLRGTPTNGAFDLDADAVRRYSQPDNSVANADTQRRNFQDALEAGHGILSLSQETPRPLAYPGQTQGPPPPGSREARGSADSYGFPATHSTSSSVSSTSFNGFYGGSSVDSNMSEYSTAGSDLESIGSRRQHMSTLPTGLGSHNLHAMHRPSYVSAVPPPAQSMMGQFSSKVTSTAQKKHKCKVCDKRFTRPSSLQTHIYSHTGEKPFACDVPGCGRNFSVVSNLRRHRKVHKDLSPSEAGSEEQHLSPE